MANNSAILADITILNGATNSRVVNGPYEYNDADSISLLAPAVLAEAVVIQVNKDPAATNASTGWVTLQQIMGAVLVDVAPPLAGKSRAYQRELCGQSSFRLVAGVAVAADRVFQCVKQWSLG